MKKVDARVSRLEQSAGGDDGEWAERSIEEHMALFDLLWENSRSLGAQENNLHAARESWRAKYQPRYRKMPPEIMAQLRANGQARPRRQCAAGVEKDGSTK